VHARNTLQRKVANHTSGRILREITYKTKRRLKMRAIKLMVALGLVAFMAGCVPSLHPLFTEEDLVYDPALVGTWAEKEGEDIWTFRKSGENAYDLIYTEETLIWCGSENSFS
jgi:hypothetical protein